MIPFEPETGRESVPKEGIPDWLRPKPASELRTQLPKQVIKNVLYAGGKLMVAGGSKSYKTWIMLDLAYSIANGLPFLGILTDRSKVFYADLELLEADCRFPFSLEQVDSEFALQVLDLLAEGRLRHVQPIRSMSKIQFLGGSDKIFQVAKFHYRLRSVRPRWAIDSSGFVESTGSTERPF